MAKPNYTKPESQLDLERRQADDYVSPSVVTRGEDVPLSDNGYIGVDPIYQNHANDTEAPVKVTKGAEAKIVNEFIADDADFDATKPEDGESEGEDGDEDDSSSTSSTTTPPRTTPPSA